MDSLPTWFPFFFQYAMTTSLWSSVRGAHSQEQQVFLTTEAAYIIFCLITMHTPPFGAYKRIAEPPWKDVAHRDPLRSYPLHLSLKSTCTIPPGLFTPPSWDWPQANCTWHPWPNPSKTHSMSCPNASTFSSCIPKYQLGLLRSEDYQQLFCVCIFR